MIQRNVRPRHKDHVAIMRDLHGVQMAMIKSKFPKRPLGSSMALQKINGALKPTPEQWLYHTFAAFPRIIARAQKTGDLVRAAFTIGYAKGLAAGMAQKNLPNRRIRKPI